MKIIKLLPLLLFLGIFVSSCEKQEEVIPGQDTEDTNSTGNQFGLVGSTFTEGFETGTKTSYAAADVTLSSGIWNMSDALIGTSTSDRKSGTKSARVTNTGKLTMKFNRTNGIGSVEVLHGKYGTDANSTWELWASSNSGSTWAKVGATITSSSTTLATATFAVNLSGNVRIEIRKTGGSTARINFDQIAFSDFGTSGGGGGGTTPTVGDNAHLTMGNPSAAANNILLISNYLLGAKDYDMSYSRDKGIPNWVSWHLNSTWIGSAPRQDDFRSNTLLPSSWYQVGNSSYTGSGFDRGHMCPSADRTITAAANSATFLMTNMIPQAPDNNQGPWARLEDYCRTLVSQGNELYIISGVYGQGGVGSTGATSTTINSGKILVPARTWKVVVVIPNGNDDISRVSAATRVIAVDMPNQQGIRSNNWGTYRVSVDAIESATGYDFLSVISSTIQSSVESKVDTGATL